jgi:hypothetical protein
MTDQSLQEIASIVRSFEHCQLPRSQWTHEAHLAVGFWLLMHYSPAEAFERMKAGIQQYNQSVGIPNSQTSGYHATITQFWLRKIQQFLVDNQSTQFTPALWHQLLQQCSDPKLPLQYYSHDCLMSWPARSSWVEPDLKTLF